ncbi:MAG: site-2 protease family protein, partial [Actinomycetota bacterium]|nr:site-2 protease family protein [Actinomycetota bacterium]
KNLFVSQQSRSELSSPIGIVAISSQTIKLGWGVYIRVLGFISLQLAIFNLLPLLPLDGGHVLFNVLEKIKGSPIKKETFERVSVVGLGLFAILFIMGLVNDIQRLLGPGFGIGP